MPKPAPVQGISHPPPAELRHSTWIYVPPDHFGFISCLSILLSIPISSSYSQAAKDPCWQTAMADKIVALETKQTWDLVPRPTIGLIIGSKWVFTVKVKSNGSLDRNKARLVAQWYKEEYEIDYEETFAPVPKMTTVRTLLGVVAIQKWPLWHMDVKNAFLDGNLRSTVYTNPPPGYTCPPNMLCYLKKALYGSKKAPRA